MRKRKSLLIVLLLLLVGVSTSYVAGTYAKYIGEVSGNGTATVAKWAFESDNAITTINVNLAETYATSRLTSGKIAPGTSGYFNVALVNTNSEVGVDWTLALGSVTNGPTNLKFYKDSSHSTALTPGTSTITGQLAAGDSTGLTVTIYWDWPYETGTVTNGVAAGDSDDTTDGVAAETLSIPITIKGVQVQPLASSAQGATITSHVNQ